MVTGQVVITGEVGGGVCRSFVQFLGGCLERLWYEDVSGGACHEANSAETQSQTEAPVARLCLILPRYHHIDIKYPGQYRIEMMG